MTQKCFISYATCEQMTLVCITIDNINGKCFTWLKIKRSTGKLHTLVYLFTNLLHISWPLVLCKAVSMLSVLVEDCYNYQKRTSLIKQFIHTNKVIPKSLKGNWVSVIIWYSDRFIENGGWKRLPVETSEGGEKVYKEITIKYSTS